MRFTAIAYTALIGAGVCAPTVAMAQAATPTLGAGRDFTIGARVTGTYDTNSAKADKTVQQIRGLSEEDYILNAAMTARIVQPFGRQMAYLQGEVGYDAYRNNPKLDSRRAALNSGVAVPLGPCTQVGTLSYSVGQSDLANLSLGTVENVSETITYGATVQCARSVGPGVALSVQRAEVSNSAQQIEESESNVDSANLGIFYARPSLGTFTLGFAYSDASFPKRAIPGRGLGDGFYSQAYNVAYSRAFSTRLSVNGSLGRVHLKREFTPPGAPSSINTTTFGGGASYKLGRSIDFNLSAGRTLTPSQVVGKTYDKITNAGLNVNYRLGDRISLRGGYSWAETRSNVDTAAALLVVTNSTIEMFSAGASFAPNDIMSLTLNVQQMDRKANLPQFNFNSLRVALSAQASF